MQPFLNETINFTRHFVDINLGTLSILGTLSTLKH